VTLKIAPYDIAHFDFLLKFYRALSHVVSEIFTVEKYRNLQIRVKT